MHYSKLADVAGPGLLFAAAGGILALCIASLVIIILEGLILWRLRWSSFARAMLASLVMNITTSILGIGVVAFTLPLGVWGLVIDYALSILAEGLVLMLFKRSAARENGLTAFWTNSASYALIILPLYLLLGLLK